MSWFVPNMKVARMSYKINAKLCSASSKDSYLCSIVFLLERL